jgi:hypothetical protein
MSNTIVKCSAKLKVDKNGSTEAHSVGPGLSKWKIILSITEPVEAKFELEDMGLSILDWNKVLNGDFELDIDCDEYGSSFMKYDKETNKIIFYSNNNQEYWERGMISKISFPAPEILTALKGVINKAVAKGLRFGEDND